MYYVKNAIGYYWQKALTVARILLIPATLILCICGQIWVLAITIPLFFILGIMRSVSEKNVIKRTEKRIKKIGYENFMAELNSYSNMIYEQQVRDAISNANFQNSMIQMELQGINNSLLRM